MYFTLIFITITFLTPLNFQFIIKEIIKNAADAGSRPHKRKGETHG